MAQLTYRDAVSAAIAQEMLRDSRVVLLGEDAAAAGGVFKTTVGLFEQFGPTRVRDTPISELAIMGAAMDARTPIMTITMMSSMRVNPCLEYRTNIPPIF